jgi:hypothetical protein
MASSSPQHGGVVDETAVRVDRTYSQARDGN